MLRRLRIRYRAGTRCRLSPPHQIVRWFLQLVRAARAKNRDALHIPHSDERAIDALLVDDLTLRVHDSKVLPACIDRQHIVSASPVNEDLVVLRTHSIGDGVRSCEEQGLGSYWVTLQVKRRNDLSESVVGAPL
jgi:hypothetical protein